jgi:benzoate-CoA ligase family protein
VIEVPVTDIAPTPYNATVDLLERNLREHRGEAAYLLTEERTWTYAEVAQAADAAGHGLLTLGLQPGDRVILALRDRPEFVNAFWGSIKAGLVPVPVAQGLAPSDIEFMLADSEARAIICDESSAPTVLQVAPEATSVEYIFVGASVADGTRAWDEVCGGASELTPASTTSEDIALWLYTSGTTGLPKAVMHRHRHLRDAPAALARQVIALGPDDIVLSVSKMFFAYGLGNSVYLPASVGASVVLNDAPSIPARIQALLTQTRPTVVLGVPAFFAGLARLPDGNLPPSTRMVLSAGEALSAELLELFRQRFGLPLIDGLGSTEALHHVTSNRPDDVVAGSAGRALDGYEVEARDRDGQPVREGQSGEFWVRGPTTFAGYWRRPELTTRAYSADWMRTGDLVRIVDGRVYHEGRMDDLMKLGGVWVAPAEIEDVLRSHGDVVDAAVVAVDDEVGVPILKAYVLSDRNDAGISRELTRFCRGRLAAFKIPRSFEIVPELPRTPTGKLRRFVLRSGDASPAS